MSPSTEPLRRRARKYIALTALFGNFIVLARAIFHWESPDLLKYCGFLMVAIFSCGIMHARAGNPGYSLAYVCVRIVRIAELSPSETIVLGALVTLIQSCWNQPHRPRAAQVLFKVTSMAVAIAVAERVYVSYWLTARGVDPSLRLAAATGALFLFTTVPMALVIAIVEDTAMMVIWWQNYFWSLPYYLGGAAVAQVASIVANSFGGWQTVLLTGPVVYLIYRSYRLYLERLAEEKKHAEAVSSLHLRTIEALALAIEAKDHTTHGHLQRVQVYATEMGKELGLTTEEREALRAAALLHDIGKLAVPEHIISKPGRLTPEEFEKMKIHPTVGAEILERVQFPYPVVPIVRAHHEKWDGSGYPHGISGEEIPIGARILSVVDCLDALATDRQYRRALPLDEAMKVVQNDAGKAFDPRVVEVLTRRYVEAGADGAVAQAKRGKPFDGSKDHQRPGAGGWIRSVGATRP